MNMKSNFIKNLKINLNFNKSIYTSPTHFRLYAHLKGKSEEEILKMLDSDSFFDRLLAHRFTDFIYIEKALSDAHWQIRLSAHLSTDFNNIELALNDEYEFIRNLALENQK